MKIISQILLLSLILVISCDKDSVSSEEESFSVIGDWNVYFNNTGSWVLNNMYKIKNDGKIDIYSNGSFLVSWFYYYCEDSNIFQYGGFDFDGNCDCISDPASQKVTTEGLTIFYWTTCSGNSPHVKFVKS